MESFNASMGDTGSEFVQIEIPDLNPATSQDITATSPQSMKTRGGHEFLSTASEVKDKPSEYALHILFTQFVRYTERKLNSLVNYDDAAGFMLVQQLAPGTDKEFDQILKSLAHVARRNPKPVIDSIMYWRKSKTDLAANSSSRGPKLLAEARSMVSIYILTRALIEIINETPPEVLGEDLGEKLEEIVFKQLVQADPFRILGSPVRHANWIALSQLLGDMSSHRFASVNDRFIGELEKVPRDMTRLQEASTILLVKAMAHIKVRLYPEEYLEESANFFESLTKFYERTTSTALKDCYAEVASGLLEAVAENSTAEVNHPAWSAAIERLYYHALRSAKKAPESSLTLAAMTLCVSPQSLFVPNWLPLMESQWNKSKSKWNSKQNFIFVALSRVLWISAHRCTETLNVTRRKLEVITKLFLTFSRKYWSLLDVSAVNATVSILVSAFCLYPQYALDEIIFPMLTNIDAAHITRVFAVDLDGLIPEKAIIAVEAFAQCVIYTKTGNRPEFPSSETLKRGFKEGKMEQSETPVTKSLESSMDLFCHCLGRILTLLTQQLDSGDDLVSFQNSLTQLFGINVGVRSESVIDWLAKIITTSTIWAPNIPRFWHVICSQVQSPLGSLSGSAYRAVSELAETSDVLAMLSIQSKSLFTLDSRILTTQTPPPWLDLELELKLNADLVQILIDRLTSNDKPLFKDATDMALSTVWSLLEEIEGNALYFFSSQFRGIRCAALRILGLASDLAHSLDVFMQKSGDDADGETGRVYSFFENTDLAVFTSSSANRDHYSGPEKTRIAALNAKKRMTIARLASSDYGVDSAIWLKIFPYVITQCFDKYPMPVAIARNIICSRLVQMHDIVISVVENDYEKMLNFLTRSSAKGHTEMIIEQWRIFLMLACATLTVTEEQKLHIPKGLGQAGHGRKKSSQKITVHHQKITSARSVFKIVFPLLSVNHVLVREAVVSGISCVNVNTYPTLLECLKEPFEKWQLLLLRSATTASTANSAPAIKACTEVAHILMRTSYSLENTSEADTPAVQQLITQFIDMFYEFLICEHIQIEPKCQTLRRYFCGFLSDVLALYGIEVLGTQRQQHLYHLILGWSTYGRFAEDAARREAAMRKASLASARDAHERSLYLASLEFDNKKFDIATSRALSYLLLGSQSDASILDHLDWLHALLSSSQEVLQFLAVQGLERLILSNNENQMLIDELVLRCYKSSSASRVSKIYFQGLSTVFLENLDKLENIDPLNALACAVFKLGSENLHQREYAIRLMNIIEKLYNIEWPVASAFKARSSSRTTRRRLIYEHSKMLSTNLEQFGLQFFTALTAAFPLVALQEKRDLVSALLPWIQNSPLLSNRQASKALNFDVIASDKQATLILCTMVRLTDLFGLDLSYEIEALWMGICTGEYGQINAEITCEFLMGLCLLTKNPATISVSKQIFTYLAGSPAELPIVEHLLQYLDPKWMITPTWKYQDSELADKLKADSGFGPGDKNTLLMGEEVSFSYCQLCIMMLVDVSSLNELIFTNLPVILHVCVTLADHFTDFIQKGAQNLLGSLVTVFSIKETEKDFAILDRISGPKALQWQYDDMNASSHTKLQGSITVPDNMVRLIRIVVTTLSKRSRNLEQVWAREALRWATTCPVRHIACRSFQLFRVLNCSVDQRMLADMLARLSTTIADSAPETQGFALQILMTLNSVANMMNVDTLAHSPQLFWATMAAMETTNEREYVEALSTANRLLERLDFGDPMTLSLLASAFPSKWEGKFKNVQSNVLLGLKSCNSYELSHEVLILMCSLAPSAILKDSNFAAIVLATNLPKFLHAMDTHQEDTYRDVVKQLEQLIDDELATGVSPQPLSTLRKVLTSFVNSRFWSRHDFMQQYVTALAAAYPESLVEVMLVLLDTLSLPTRWAKVDTMAVLKLVVPMVNNRVASGMESPGADLVSPLLRLLQTDLAQQALDILDEASNIAGNKLESQVLRLSLNAKPAKDQDTIPTRFGIPDENGWSVPQPALASTVTRNNIHAVFYTCDTSAETLDAESVSFDFNEADPQGDELLPAMESENPGAEICNMQSMLEDLDTFFTSNVPQTQSPKRHYRSASSVSRFLPRDEPPTVGNGTLYENGVAHLLDPSLSISSQMHFQEPFEEHHGSPLMRAFDPQTSIISAASIQGTHRFEEINNLGLSDYVNSEPKENINISPMALSDLNGSMDSNLVESQSKFRLEKFLGVKQFSKSSGKTNLKASGIAQTPNSSPNRGKLTPNFQFP